MRTRRVLDRGLRDESGMTLVELLTVMIMAIITSLALFSFQDLVLRQSNRVFARVDATQDARMTVERIQSRLQSSCVAEGVTPIFPGSDGDTLIFVSKYGSAATLAPDKHVIELSGTTLTDTTYPHASGTTPATWQFSPTGSTQRIHTAVKEPQGKSAFIYYGYGIAKNAQGANYVDTAGNPYYMLLDGLSTLPSNARTSGGASVPAGTMPANSPSPIPVPLSPQNAARVVAVSINLVVDADGGIGANPNNDRAEATVSDSVVLRITPVPSDNNQGVPAPCE